MNSLLETTGLVTVRCWCGIQHAIPGNLREEQLRQFHDGNRNVLGIYCPLGHQHVPRGETKTQQLNRSLQRERSAHDQTKAELQTTERRRRGEKAAKTRLQNRVGNGVCPCCRRSFTNVRRHIANKHPDYVDGAETSSSQ